MAEQSSEVSDAEQAGFEYFDIETPYGQFPGYEDIVAAWYRARGAAWARVEALLPRWTDFSASDLLGWDAHMARSIDSGDGDDVRFLIFGRELKRLMGADYTGKSFAELSTTDIYTSLISPHWRHFFTSPKIAIGYLPVRIDGVRQALSILHLPLGEGKRVTGALHAAQRVMPTTIEPLTI